MSYRDLEIWRLARELVLEIHKMINLFLQSVESGHRSIK